MPEQTQPDVTATPVTEVPSDYREYERWRKAGGNTATGPAAEAGDQPQSAETAPVPEPEQPPETEEEPAGGTAPDEDETAPAATRPGRKERLIERQAREIEELRQQLAQQQPKPAEKPPEKAAEGKPRLHDFETLEAYQEALTDWKITQRERERAEADTRQTLESGWKSKQDDARTLYPDYDEAITSARMPETPNQGVLRQALLDDPHGPKVAYWLAKHPEDLERIAGLSPVGAVREIGRISAQFDQESSGTGNLKPKISSAPPPPPSISRPAKTGSDSVLDDRVAKDWRKWNRLREAQLKER